MQERSRKLERRKSCDSCLWLLRSASGAVQTSVCPCLSHIRDLVTHSHSVSSGGQFARTAVHTRCAVGISSNIAQIKVNGCFKGVIVFTGNGQWPGQCRCRSWLNNLGVTSIRKKRGVNSFLNLVCKISLNIIVYTAPYVVCHRGFLTSTFFNEVLRISQQAKHFLMYSLSAIRG